MRWGARFFRWHRWLGYAVALQVLVWVAGGAVFAWLPFSDWVKAETLVSKPRQDLPPDWAQHLGAMPTGLGALRAVQSVATARGPALKLRFEQGERFISLGGGDLQPPTHAVISVFARQLYQGDGKLQAVAPVAEVPRRLGLVRELGGRRDVWVARFADAHHTRLYFDGRSGEFITARTEAWVLYDFFWRLHVMDYEGGEDFNNTLLRVASVAALLLTATGLTLSTLALRRAWRRRAQADDTPR